MARTNRNNRDVHVPAVGENPRTPIYRTAIYARLSVEDNGCGSDSIDHQIQLIRQYVDSREELRAAGTFYDNGMTGCNFARPGFTAMMDEIKRGNIHCIVVKDLSRFGRNYIETGRYLEEIFPSLGVRFISVNDHYDSLLATPNEGLALSLKNVYHHIYARDISRKIGTLFEMKKRRGEFLGRFAPYGYKKSEGNPHQLEIDEETAPIVKDVFKMRLEGMGVTAIARHLNDRGVPSYYRMLFEKGMVRGTNGEADALWSGSSVKGMLENPVYCGHMVERKKTPSFHYSEVRKIPKWEWVYIQNTHEPIIDTAAFREVQYLIEKSREERDHVLERTSRREATENPLRGFLLCGYCKKKMIRDSGYYKTDGTLIRHRFYCTGKYRKGNHCRSVSKEEGELMSALSCIMSQQIQAFYQADIKGKPGALLPIGEEGEHVLSRKLCKAIIGVIEVYKDYFIICYAFDSPYEQSPPEGKE